MRFRLPLALLAAALLALAVAASASAAPGLEVAVQDDAQLLSDNFGSRGPALDAAVRARRRLHPRQRRLGRHRAQPHVPPRPRRARLRLHPLRPPDRRGRRPRPARPAHPHRPGAGLGLGRPQGGRRPAGRQALRRLRRPGRGALPRPRDPLQRLERAELARLAAPREGLPPRPLHEDRRPPLPRALRRRLLAIKRSDPAAQVWIGETSPNLRKGRNGAPLSTAPLKFLREMTCRDGIVKGCRGTLKADGYAHHPYEFAHAPNWRDPNPDNVTIGTLGRLRSALSKLSRARALRYTGSRRDAGLPDRVRLLLERLACAVAGQARQLHAAGVRDGAPAGRPPARLLPAARPARGPPWRSGLMDPAGQPHPAFGAVRDFVTQNAPRLARRG